MRTAWIQFPNLTDKPFPTVRPSVNQHGLAGSVIRRRTQHVPWIYPLRRFLYIYIYYSLLPDSVHSVRSSPTVPTDAGIRMRADVTWLPFRCLWRNVEPYTQASTLCPTLSTLSHRSSKLNELRRISCRTLSSLYCCTENHLGMDDQEIK